MTSAPRYSPAMQALHWLMAALVFASMAVAWAMISLPRTAPDREFWYTIHKSLGVTLFALVAARIFVRARSTIPAEPRNTLAWMTIAARISHLALYAILIVMPISGYIVSSAGGHDVSVFGLLSLPALPNNPALQAAARTVHQTTQWAVYALITTHLLATIWHVAIRRDGLLNRMTPPQQD